MKTFFRSASTFLLAAMCAGPLFHGPMLHAAVLPNRLSRNAASTALEELPQGVSSRVRSSTALGHLSGDTRLDTMSLVLAPSAEQSAALDQLLADQQNPASPRYHQWLTPEEFGAQFGISDSDLQVLQNWLTNQGFQVTDVARSRNRITFSGSAATVEVAFHTEMDTFRRGDQQFFENNTAPEMPAALQSVVSAITGLSSYMPRPQVHRVASAANLAGQAPRYTSTAGNHSVAPWDFRQIYNAQGLFNSGNTGVGITIAVIGQSSVDLNQIAYFQQLTGQSRKAPTLLLVPNTGSGVVRPGDEGESEADLEYASGVAPGASIVFVYSGNSTTYNNGNGANVNDALLYAITTRTGQIISYSYGGCETANNSAALVAEESFFRQANAQGQTVVVAAGDSGAAGCEDGSSTTAYAGLQVSYPASSPYITAIGGTEFSDTANPASFWNSTNNSQAGSALGYITEMVWNDNATDPLAAGGGGASRVFSKPNWQVASGVPSDGARDIPDISFTAGEHDPYIFCTSDTSFVTSTSTGACTASAFGNGRVGGTSLPTPAFAGALAMMLNANNNTKGVGNINPLLYSLSRTTPSLFHDVTSGNNIVPCATGTLGCTNGSIGYNATAGYDLATGLGSVDLGALSSNLAAGSSAQARVPTLSVTLGLTSTASFTLTGSVGGNATTVAPTGTVTLSLDGGTAFTQNGFPPQPISIIAGSSNTGATFSASITGTFSLGVHTLVVSYSGDSNFSPATTSISFSIPSAITNTGNYALSASPSSLTIDSNTAHAGSWTLTTTASNGFSGLVLYSVAAAAGSRLPATGCFLGPDQAGLATNATVNTTVTFSYSSADCSGANAVAVFGNTRRMAVNRPSETPAHSPQSRLPLLAIGFTGLLGSAAFRRRRLWMTGLVAIAIAVGSAGLSGCGSGSAPLSTGTTPGTGTISNAPKGTYNLVFSVQTYIGNQPPATTNVTLVIQ